MRATETHPRPHPDPSLTAGFDEGDFEEPKTATSDSDDSTTAEGTTTTEETTETGGD